jgi:hypothetical protein
METIAAAIVGDEGAILIVVQVIHPGYRSIRPFNDVFFFFRVKVTVTHNHLLNDFGISRTTTTPEVRQ